MKYCFRDYYFLLNLFIDFISEPKPNVVTKSQHIIKSKNKQLNRQAATTTDIVPAVVASIIYEESSDSDHSRMMNQFRNQKRVGKKVRNQRRKMFTICFCQVTV